MSIGSQSYADDPRNASVLVHVNGALVPRDEARVSVFDAGFVLGDGVWEGFRLIKGRVAFMERHLDRLYAGARAIDLDIGRSRIELAAALYETIVANNMVDGVHIRLMVTRGLKRTPNQDPRMTIGPATLVIVAEWKEPSPALFERGLHLASVPIRCTPADMFDMRLNSHSRLNLIIALNHAIKAGADEALMLDPHGFVSSCNATNFFMVKRGTIVTSSGDYCFNGITRAHVIELARANNLPLELRNFTLAEVGGADEAFVTGTFGGLTPATRLDGRPIGSGRAGPVTEALKTFYLRLRDAEGR
ncbi:aminotransferase class IV [Zavarzinia compransoris]|uniref:Probable branched-chain-amino-acid aminotransferase n=1 Tax=Zavarzinia compransoris TaxID=1264899 RepID=A0A317DZ78_9PROT|nr:aminotransferase class IV [Zavarzinia compransoris]PWR19721.1 aminotransferase class IV [Zavarzinia compransoris]TDP43332.1 branched-chain amino acid aminotransferase [Zavarzinia compransoris]